jgi:hypothetical protein
VFMQRHRENTLHLQSKLFLNEQITISWAGGSGK